MLCFVTAVCAGYATGKHQNGLLLPGCQEWGCEDQSTFTSPVAVTISCIQMHILDFPLERTTIGDEYESLLEERQHADLF